MEQEAGGEDEGEVGNLQLRWKASVLHNIGHGCAMFASTLEELSTTLFRAWVMGQARDSV